MNENKRESTDEFDYKPLFDGHRVKTLVLSQG